MRGLIGPRAVARVRVCVRQEVGSVSISMSSSVEIGLAVTSHDDTKLAQATFDSVQ